MAPRGPQLGFFAPGSRSLVQTRIWISGLGMGGILLPVPGQSRMAPVPGGPMVRFLLNPAAGRGTGAAHIHRLRILASRAGAGLVSSKSAADLAEQARRAVADGVLRLVVAGGDGTLHHV